MTKHEKYLTDPTGYLDQATRKEKYAYYMGYEHGKQAMESGIVDNLLNQIHGTTAKEKT